jgi:hypothetical protein
MRIYTASKFENHQNVRLFNERLRDQGHVVTWDWTDTHEFDVNGDIVGDGLSDRDRKVYCMLDYAGVTSCELLIFLDGPDFIPNGGRWEAGIAVGAGAQVWIVNYSHTVIFDELPQVKIVPDEDTALSLLGRATTFV